MAFLGSPAVVDDGSAALILQLQREDVEAICARDKTKQRAGKQTDAQLALQLYLEELQIFETTLSDQQMARSIASAVLADSQSQASSDHEIATRLDGTAGNRSIASSQFTREEKTLDEVSLVKLDARQFADMYNLTEQRSEQSNVPYSEPSKWAASRKPVELDETIRCVACSDSKPWFDVATVPCGDQYCVGCLSTLFRCCLLYTSPSPRDGLLSRMPSSA